MLTLTRISILPPFCPNCWGLCTKIARVVSVRLWWKTAFFMVSSFASNSTSDIVGILRSSMDYCEVREFAILVIIQNEIFEKQMEYNFLFIRNNSHSSDACQLTADSSFLSSKSNKFSTGTHLIPKNSFPVVKLRLFKLAGHIRCLRGHL